MAEIGVLIHDGPPLAATRPTTVIQLDLETLRSAGIMGTGVDGDIHDFVLSI
jgi:hypothetical protein